MSSYPELVKLSSALHKLEDTLEEILARQEKRNRPLWKKVLDILQKGWYGDEL